MCTPRCALTDSWQPAVDVTASWCLANINWLEHRRRQLLAASSSSIRVDITIIVASDSSARNVATSLTLSALNYELNLEGLPAAVMVCIKKCGLGFKV